MSLAEKNGLGKILASHHQSKLPMEAHAFQYNKKT